MAYAVTADVQKYFLDFPITSSSRITTANVDEVCDTESVELDGILLGAGFTVPITGANSLKIMKKICALRVAASCWRKLHVTTQSDQPTMADEWRKEADELLEAVLSGEMLLVDAPTESSTSISSGPRFTSRDEIFERGTIDDFKDAHGNS